MFGAALAGGAARSNCAMCETHRNGTAASVAAASVASGGCDSNRRGAGSPNGFPAPFDRPGIRWQLLHPGITGVVVRPVVGQRRTRNLVSRARGKGRLVGGGTDPVTCPAQGGQAGSGHPPGAGVRRSLTLASCRPASLASVHLFVLGLRNGLTPFGREP